MNEALDPLTSSDEMQIASTASKEAVSHPHVDKIDALRFIAAFWVAMSHGALPLQYLFSDPLLHRLSSAFTMLFDGVAAVTVFFVISGFCIHLPYSGAREFSWASFMTNRCIRVGTPLVAILLIMHIFGGEAADAGNAVLWSVYAELMYYLGYPLLYFLARKTGWMPLVLVSALIASGMALSHRNYLWVWQFGSWTWLWGLPIWLSGCLLAEKFRQYSLVSVVGSIWLWRMSAWVLGAAATIAVFHAPFAFGYPVSMLLFLVLVYFWLSLELQTPWPKWRIIGNFGRASYSLYLVHNVVIGVLAGRLASWPPAVAVLLPWLAIVLATYAFYTIVEAPTHILARSGARIIFDLTAHRKKF